MSEKNTHFIHALVLHKKDISHAHRRVLLVSQELPFFWATAFGAAHSARLSGLTSPFVLIQAKVTHSPYGPQLSDCHGLEFYTQINESLEYFHMVSAWVKMLLQSSGIGEDRRLFTMLHPLFQETQNLCPWVILDTLFCAQFLHLSGQLPASLEGICLEELLKETPQVQREKNIDWDKLRKTLQIYLNRTR